MHGLIPCDAIIKIIFPVEAGSVKSTSLIGLSSTTSRFSETAKNSQVAEVPSVDEILQHVHRRPEDNALLSKEELDDELAKIMAEDSSDNEKQPAHKPVMPTICEDDQSSGNETWESNEEEEAEEENEEEDIDDEE